MRTGTWIATLSLCVLGGLLPAADQRTSPASKPNIILILSDDVGLGDIGCCGGPFKTPQIDSLAKGGTRFEYCYSTPLCGPSRCQLLTGRYPLRTGLINNNSHDAIQPSREIMIPTVMKKAGYVTASVGKWGQMCLGPGEWGFDEYIVFPGSGHYWGEQTPRYRVNGEQKTLAEGPYLPDLMHDFAVKFITRHKDQPFFLYYPMSHIHGPILRTPDSKPGADKDQLYRDNVEYMDKLVGKLIAELGRLHLREKTLILFAGDNGTARLRACPPSPTKCSAQPMFSSAAHCASGAPMRRQRACSRCSMTSSTSADRPARRITAPVTIRDSRVLPPRNSEIAAATDFCILHSAFCISPGRPAGHQAISFDATGGQAAAHKEASAYPHGAGRCESAEPSAAEPVKSPAPPSIPGLCGRIRKVKLQAHKKLAKHCKHRGFRDQHRLHTVA